MDSLLGGEREIIEGVLLGSIQMTPASEGIYSYYDKQSGLPAGWFGVYHGDDLYRSEYPHVSSLPFVSDWLLAVLHSRCL